MQSNSRVSLIVVLLFALAAWVSCHVFVAHFASRMPFEDDLELVSALEPGETLTSTLDWWWRPANEHRIPIPRGIYLALLRSTHDFRAGMHFQVVVQALTAIGLIFVARKLRGRTSLADVVFPLLLATWANAENFLLGMQITIAVPTALVCGFLALGLRRPELPSWRAASGMGLCMLLLPLNGGFGLMQTPALLAWSSAAAWLGLRSPNVEARKSGAAFAIASGATLFLIALYFVDFQFPKAHSHSSDPAAIATTSLGFLTLGFGPIVRDHLFLAIFTTAIFAGSSAWLALRAGIATHSDRWRASLCFAVILAACTIALSIGIARSDDGSDAGTAFRYVTLPVPMFVAAYFAWTLLGPPRIANWFQGLLALVLLAVVPFDVELGREIGMHRATIAAEFENAVRERLSLKELVARYQTQFYPTAPEFLAQLKTMVAARWPPFDELAPGESWPSGSPFFMFATRPRESVSPPHAEVRFIDRVAAAVLRADDEFEFELAPGAARIHARFGAPTVNWTRTPKDPSAHAGLRIRLTLRGASGESRVVFERTLRPRENVDDRLAQEIDVELPANASGTLVLETRLPDGRKSSIDWSYWTEFEIR